MSLQPHTEIIVTIEKPVAGGRMLARHEGQIVLVAGAIPGERVRVRIDRVSKHLAFADDRRACSNQAATGAPSTRIGHAAARSTPMFRTSGSCG